MKKIIKNFLLIGMILGIIYIIASIVFMVISTKTIIEIYNTSQEEQSAGSATVVVFVLPMFIVYLFIFVILFACSIVCTVLNAVAYKKFKNAKTLQEAKKIRGIAIAGGIFMLTIFPIIASGLINKLTEEDWEAI